MANDQRISYTDLKDAPTAVPLSVKDFGAVGNGTTDDTLAFQDAIATVTANGGLLAIPEGTYKLSGNTAFDIDLGRISVFGEGSVTLDCSTMTSNYAFHVFSSLSYPESNYVNTTHIFQGLAIVGGRLSGYHGIRIGHPSNAGNGQLRLIGIGVYGFDRNFETISNAWRIILDCCVSLNPLTYTFFVGPSGTNTGEAMSFYHCKFADGDGAFRVEANNYFINMYSCSILNCQIQLVGNASVMNMYGGNIENPGNAVFYVYVTISGSSTLALYGTTVILNPSTTFTDSIYNLSNANSRLLLSGILFPDGSHLQFEQGAGVRAFAKGSGTIDVHQSIYYPASGGYKPTLSELNNALYNGGFETGNLDGWTPSAYGTPGSTATVVNTAAKNGTYGLKLTTVSGGGIDLYQQIPCDPGRFVSVFAWARVTTLGVSPYGAFQIRYYRADGGIIQTINDNITAAPWNMFGSSQASYAPKGTAAVRVVLNAQAAASVNVVEFDDIIVNIH